MFGLVEGHVKELGYVSLNELMSVRGPMGLAIERDLYWSPKKLGEIAPELFTTARNIADEKPIAIADGKLDLNEKQELTDLAKSLKIEKDLAKQLFKEEKKLFHQREDKSDAHDQN